MWAAQFVDSGMTHKAAVDAVAKHRDVSRRKIFYACKATRKAGYFV